MAVLLTEEVETDGAGFRALSADGHGRLPPWHPPASAQLWRAQVQKGLPGAAKKAGKFGPRIRGAHVDDSDRLRCSPGQSPGAARQSRGFVMRQVP